MRHLFLAAVLAQAASPALGDEVSLRLGGKEVPLDAAVERRLAGFARDMLRRCGPNTRQHPHNFGLSAITVEQRRKHVLEGSRLQVIFAEPFLTESHLGGTLGVSEAPSASSTRRWKATAGLKNMCANLYQGTETKSSVVKKRYTPKTTRVARPSPRVVPR